MARKDSIPLKVYVDQRFSDADKAIQAALISQEKAIIKAETAAEKRFELLNELRDGVATTDQLEALEKVVSAQSKLIYVGLGALLALQFAAQFLIK